MRFSFLKSLGCQSFQSRNVKTVIVCTLCFIFLIFCIYSCRDEKDNVLCHVDDSWEFISYCPEKSALTPPPLSPTAFKLTSSALDGGFDPGMAIPDDFKDVVRRVGVGSSARGHQCEGRNEFPKLTWTNIPANAEALVLIVEDVTGGDWVHLNAWYNKPADGSLPNQIARLSVADLTTLNDTDSDVPAFPSGWQTGMNSWSELTGIDQVRPHGGWSGPCPPMGTGSHTYYFKLYALNAQVDPAAAPVSNMTRAAFESGAPYMSQIIGQTEISGTASFGSAPSPPMPPPPPPSAFTLTSSASDDGFDPGMVIPGNFKDTVRRVGVGSFPRGHRCDGRNEFPKLTWSNIPDGTEALVLIVEDATGGNWVHLNAWYNKPGGGTLPTEIAKLSVSDPATLNDANSDVPAFPSGWQTGRNSWSTLTGSDQVRPHGGWSGPCPPNDGTGSHTYYFKLYALNAQIAAPVSNMTRAAFEGGAPYMSQIIGQTEISGTASFTVFTLTSSASDDGFDPGMPIPGNFKDLVSRAALRLVSLGNQCEGRNEFPKLTWSNIPDGAEALVLIVENAVARNWVHLNAWYNKPPGGTLPTEIPKRSVTDLTTLTRSGPDAPALPSGWQTGINSWSRLTGSNQVRPHSGWAAPCPFDDGVDPHIYYFKLYALNAQVATPINNMNRANFESGAPYTSQIMDQTEIFATASFTVFTLRSSLSDDGFNHGGPIPENFKNAVPRSSPGQCTGQNEFPKLTWSNIPDGTEALVLIIEDPTGGNWVHLNAWYNKPPGGTLPTEIPKLSVSDPATLTTTSSNVPAFPAGWQTGQNGWNGSVDSPDTGWGGPCPPTGTGTHDYYFKLYALNAQVTAPVNGMTRAAFESSIIYTSQIMDQTEIFGTASHPLTLTSSAANDGFDPGETIPANFRNAVPRSSPGQCTGQNEFPKLTWTNIPDGTEALVLIVEDPTGSNWVHLNAWYNKPMGGTLPTEIAKLSVSDPATLTTTSSNVPAFPSGWRTGQNSWNGSGDSPDTGWGGPCPPTGTGTHTYYFKLYALGAQIDPVTPINNMTRAAFESSYMLQILDQVEISGTASHPLTLTSSLANDGFDPGMVIPDDFKDVVRRVAVGTSTRGHQCNGRNEFPKLTWANVPANAEALVLIVEDPTGGNWVHLNAWYNKPSGGTLPTEIAKLSVTDLTTLTNTASNVPAFPSGWQTGMNSWSTLTGSDQVRPHGGWGGPCPPMGTGTHTYYFKLYALNAQVAAPINGMTRTDFEGSAAYASQIMDQAEISGTADP